jgi:predicted DNA-binding protein
MPAMSSGYVRKCVSVHVALSPEDAARLAAIVKRTRQTRTALVREWIDMFADDGDDNEEGEGEQWTA